MLLLVPAGDAHAHVRSSAGYSDVRGQGSTVRYLGGVLSPPAVSGDTVYVGANNGHLYGLDRGTGAERWKFEIGSWVASGPAISGNALLAGAWDGNLYAFTED